jgi:hypothetical protein
VAGSRPAMVKKGAMTGTLKIISRGLVEA